MEFEKVFQGLYHGVVIVDSGGSILACNQAARELLKLDAEVVGKEAWLVLADATLTNVLAGGKPCYNYQMKIGKRTLRAHYKPVFSGSDLSGVVISYEDATELESMAQELEEIKELNRELEVVFDSSYDEIFVTDGDGTTLRVNKSCQRFYGMSAEEIVGKNVNELEKQGVFSPSITPRVIKEGKRLTSLQTTKSGQKLIVTANPVFDEKGSIIKIVTSSRDITELSNLKGRLDETEKLIEIYRNELAQFRKERLNSVEMVGKSPTIRHILDLAGKVAGVDSTVLVEGESGVGKGVIASKIHHLSKRKDGPFITINCGAIPENLIESELFGYEAGAFTGAKKEGKKGLIELANRGTLFLDEISELPINLQVKLLHVIQERKLMRIGGGEYTDVDIRIIAATNRDIQNLIKEKKFREDLYYRLNVVPLIVPPLRHRKEDIPLLLDYFLTTLCVKYQLRKEFASETMEILTSYSWPGNVRELENLVERLVVTTDVSEILPVHLPEYILHGSGSIDKIFVLDICPLKDAADEMERQLLKKAFDKYKNTYRMAEALGVNQSTVVRKMHRLGIIRVEDLPK